MKSLKLGIVVIIVLVLAGCFDWFSVKVPAPESFILKKSDFSQAIAEVDQWNFNGSAYLKTATYKIPFEEGKEIILKVNENTKLTMNLQANMAPYKVVDKGYEVMPWFNTFSITASKAIEVGLSRNELISVKELNHSKGELKAKIRLHLANTLGYAISTYILRNDLATINNFQASKFSVKSLNITNVNGIYAPGSEVKVAANSILLGDGATIELFDFVKAENGDLSSAFNFTAGAINIEKSAPETADFTLTDAGLTIVGAANYNKHKLTITTNKGGLNGYIAKLTTFDGELPAFVANNVQLTSTVGTFSFSRTEQVSTALIHAKLQADSIEAHGPVSYTIENFSPIDLSLSGMNDELGFTLDSKDSIIASAKDILFSEGKGLSISSAEMVISPFSVNQVKDIKFTVPTLSINTDTICYGVNTPDEAVEINPHNTLELTFNKPVVLGIGEKNRDMTFNISSQLIGLDIKSEKLPQVSFTNINLDVNGNLQALKGTLTFSSEISAVNGIAIHSLAQNAKVNIPELAFTYTKEEGLNLDALHVTVQVPQSQLEQLVRKELSKPTEPTYGGVPGRDLTRWTSAFIIKDTRTRNNIYGVHLGSLTLNGSSANVTIGGAIRSELQGKVLTTKMVNKVISKKRPCFRKNRWGITVPTTCNDPITTKVPVTYHKWKRLVAATVKAGIGGRVHFNPSVNKPLSQLSFEPVIKITSIDIKHVPGFLDKNFLTPLVYLFVNKKALEPIVVFDNLPNEINNIFSQLKLVDITFTSEQGNVVLDVKAVLDTDLI